jgi:hypothetical protein
MGTASTKPEGTEKTIQGVTFVTKNGEWVVVDTGNPSIFRTAKKAEETGPAVEGDTAPANRNVPFFTNEDYEPYPESPGAIKRIRSWVSDAGDWLSGSDSEPNEVQKEVRAYDAAADEVLKQNQGTYNMIGERHLGVAEGFYQQAKEKPYIGKFNSHPTELEGGQPVPEGAYYQNTEDGNQYALQNGEWGQVYVSGLYPFSTDVNNANVLSGNMTTSEPTPAGRIQEVEIPSADGGEPEVKKMVVPPPSPDSIPTKMAEWTTEVNREWTDATFAKTGDFFARLANGEISLTEDGELEDSRIIQDLTGGQQFTADFARYGYAAIVGGALGKVGLGTVGLSNSAILNAEAQFARYLHKIKGVPVRLHVRRLQKAAENVAEKAAGKFSKDPAKVKRVVDNFGQTIVVGGSALIGEAVVTPEDTVPLLVRKDYVQEVFKDIPDQQAEDIAVLIDSALLGKILVLAGGAVMSVARPVAQKAAGFKKLQDKVLKSYARKTQGYKVINYLDPEIFEGPVEVQAYKLKQFADALGDNKTATLAFGGVEGQVRQETMHSLHNGVEQYVRRAYAYRADMMTPDEFTDFVGNKSSEILNNFIALRRAEGNIPEMIQATANSMADVSNIINRAADKQADASRIASGETVDALETPGQRAIDASREAGGTLGSTQRDKLLDIEDEVGGKAQQISDIDSQMGEVIPTELDNAGLSDPRGQTPYSTSTQMEEVMGTPNNQTVLAIKQSREAVNAAFDDLPDNIPVDWDMFFDGLAKLDPKASNPIEALAKLGLESDGYNAIKKAIKPEPVPKLDELGAPMMDDNGIPLMVLETREQVIERLSADPSYNFKQLFKTLRPVLEDDIQRLYIGGYASKTQVPRTLKKLVDDMAEASGVPALSDAMDMYTKHVSIYTPNKALANVEKQAKLVNPELTQAAGTAKGATDANQALRQVVNSSEGDALNEVLTMLTEATGRDAKAGFTTAKIIEINQKVYRDMLEGRLDDGGLRSLLGAIEPVMESLRVSDPQKAAQLEELTRTVQDTLSGMVDKRETAKRGLEAAQQALKVQQDNILNDLVVKIEGDGYALKMDAETYFHDIFQGKGSQNKIQRLLGEVYKLPTEQRGTVLDAVQGIFIRDFRNELFTKGSAGFASPSGTSLQTEAVNASLSKIKKMKEGYLNHTLDNARMLFGDDHPTTIAILDVLNSMDVQLSSNNLKYTAGSDTIFNASLKESVDMGSVIAFGILNPTATLVRRATKGPLSKHEAKEMAYNKDAIAAILSDPEEFGTILKDLAGHIHPEGIKAAWIRMRKFFIRTGVIAASRPGDESGGISASDVIEHTRGMWEE